MKCNECVHYKLCRDLFCQVDTLTNDDKKCDYFEQKRPHGEWGEVFEHLGVKYHKCMSCYTGIKVDTTYHNFCPNCGADMQTQNDRSLDTSERGVSGSVENSIAQKEGKAE